MKVLLTSTSFQDTPGTHHDLLAAQKYDVDYLRGPVAEDVLLPIIQNYDAVICGDDQYTEAVIKKGKDGKLKFISKYGVGLDKIDLAAAKKFEIPVTNCPGVNQVSVAEHVMALLLSFEKNIHLQYNTTQAKSWKRLTGTEIHNKTFAIVGLGAIGKEVAKRALAFGMKVLVFDIRKNREFLDQYKEVEFVDDLSEVYTRADIISLHVPHNDSTEHMIDRDVIFNKIKKSPILINTSRGKLVVAEAIIEGLKSQKLKGYLADVLEVEPISDDEMLVGIDNVIISPHVGSRTFQSVQRQATMAIENLITLVNEETS